MQRIQPLAPSEHYYVENYDVETTGRFMVEYESLSGKKYGTTVEQVNGAWKHTFQKPG
jgi:hypothetical protein